MAMFPCDFIPHVHRARNANVYTRVGSGEDFTRYLCRLCPDHLALIHHDLAKYEIDTSEAATGPIRTSTDCLSCGKPVGELTWQVFITSYPAKDERKDYWAKIHVDCQLRPLYTTRVWETLRP